MKCEGGTLGEEADIDHTVVRNRHVQAIVLPVSEAERVECALIRAPVIEFSRQRHDHGIDNSWARAHQSPSAGQRHISNPVSDFLLRTGQKDFPKRLCHLWPEHSKGGDGSLRALPALATKRFQIE